MAIFALVKDGTTFVKKASHTTQPPDVPHKGLTWLPYVSSFPDFDPETEKLGPATITVEPTQVLFSAVVVALTAGEIDARETGQIDAIAKVAFEAIYNHENRIRALEGLGSITRAQLKNALKAFL